LISKGATNNGQFSFKTLLKRRACNEQSDPQVIRIAGRPVA
jgi:hypothetical protein